MPVVMNRAEATRSSGAPAAKESTRSRDISNPGGRLKFVLLSALIVAALAIVGWSMGLFTRVTQPNPGDSEKSALSPESASAASPKILTAGGGVLHGKHGRAGEDAD